MRPVAQVVIKSSGVCLVIIILLQLITGANVMLEFSDGPTIGATYGAGKAK